MLIDECLPVHLYRLLPGFEARTVAYMGWNGKKDADLLLAASGHFDILLTGDRGLPTQHKLKALGLAVVLVPRTQRRAVERKVDAILEALRTGVVGSATVVR